jgi:hypothetical protein
MIREFHSRNHHPSGSSAPAGGPFWLDRARLAGGGYNLTEAKDLNEAIAVSGGRAVNSGWRSRGRNNNGVLPATWISKSFIAKNRGGFSPG